MVAAACTLVGTVVDLIEGSGSRAIADAGVFLLDRVLLLSALDVRAQRLDAALQRRHA